MHMSLVMYLFKAQSRRLGKYNLEKVTLKKDRLITSVLLII